MATTLTRSSWGRLWDQTDAVAAHTQRGIEFFEKYGNYVKERALIEEEYAAKLRNLAKKNLGKRKEEETKSFSYINTFFTMLHELESLAGQHEVIAERLKKNIHIEVMNKCGELRQTRKNQLLHLQKLQVDLSKAVEYMEKTHRNYAKAFKEAEAAHLKHQKNDKNMNLSRAELDKSKNNVAVKNQLCESAKAEYAGALVKANEIKVRHFETELPNLLHQMKLADIDRITHTQTAMKKSIDAETSVLKIVQSCYDEMLRAVSSINPEADTQIVVEHNESGNPVPENYPFQDLGNPNQILDPDNSDSASLNSSKRGTLPLTSKNGANKSIGRRQSMHQKFFGGGSNEKAKINGTSSDYGNLPPQQRCRKIQSKLEELSKEKETLLNHLNGVEKMIEVYKSNPKMGDPALLIPKISEYKSQLAKVDSDIMNLQSLLENIQAEMRHSGSDVGMRSPYNGHTSPGSGSSPRISSSGISSAANTNRTSYSEDSVSSEGSHGFSSSRKQTAPVAPSLNGKTNLPPKESSPRPAIPSQHHEPNDHYEECEVHVIGTCTALYAFEGSTDGSTVSMKEGDEMFLLEVDTGDGWTRIRHKSTLIEGFVPSSYIQRQS